MKKSILIFLSAFILSVSLVTHYGLSWDEPIHYIRGQAYVDHFLGIKEKAPRVSVYQNYKIGGKPADYSYWLKNDSGHPPLNGIIASLFNHVFFQKLGVMGDIDSYHLFTVLISSMLVGIVFYFTYSYFGLFSGIIAALSIFLYPLFFAESHFNIKDPIEATFYAITLLFFYKAITQDNWKWIIASAVSAGFALGTKFNIFFIVFTILPWLFIYKWENIKKKRWPFSSSLTKSLIFYPFITLGLFYATWPYLWVDTWNHFMNILTYYKIIGYSITYQSAKFLTVGGINTFAVQWILYTTPLVILFFSLLGIIYTFTVGLKEKNKVSLFVFLWFIVPIARVSLPGAGIYGGARQIMEYIPAMAILSGIGAYWLRNIIIKRLNLNIHKRSSIVVSLLIVISFLPITLKIISIHPNENVYFNSLIGGLKGAKEKNIPYWGFSFGNVYKQGISWLNKNLPPNSKIALVEGLTANLPLEYLRRDIFVDSYIWSGDQKKGEYLIDMQYESWIKDYHYAGEYVENFLTPLYEIKVDNVPVLAVWKNDKEHTKSNYINENKLIISDIVRKDNDFLITLPRKMYIARIEVDFDNSNCAPLKDEILYFSSDMVEWGTERDPLNRIQVNVDNYDTSKKLIYFIAGKPAQFIKIHSYSDNPCLFNANNVTVYELSDLHL
ncbi:MAG: glycosyltransferase family 39 protein [Candidatus Levybacteria bacterium]|nr:glycosyltransferase family 39 protein [Candidatus Levybacteria bacterium]